MIKKEAIFYILGLLAGIFFITSCQLDKFDVSNLSDEKQLGQNWAAPLIKGELNTNDLLETFDSTGVISEEENGLLYIVYTDSLYSFTADDEVTIPNQDYFDMLYKVPAYDTATNYTGTKTITVDTTHLITFENKAVLDSIITDMFVLNQHVTTNIQHDLEINITYKNVVKNGQPLEDNISISANEVPYDEALSQNLEGYTIKPLDSAEKRYLRMRYEVTINGSGNDLNQNDSLSLATTVDNIDMQSAYGYIGQDTLMAQKAKIPVNLFNETENGTVQFAAPSFKFFIENSYGVPIQIELNNAKAYREGELDSTNLTFSGSANPFDINFPKFSQNEVGETVKDTITISTDNSNLEEILKENPTHIKFGSRGLSNPNSTDYQNATYNFVTENSQFRVNSELYLPLHLRAEGFSMKDTVELNMNDIIGDSTDISELTAKFKTINELPADVDFQVYFLDSTYAMVDTLFDEDDRPVIKSAATDDNGEMLSATEKISEMTFYKDEISDLSKVRNAVFEAGLSTDDFSADTTKKVKFYSDYSFKFRMSVETKVDLDLNN
jgi:hypothetical protein